MEKKSIIFMSLIALISSSMMNASTLQSFDGRNLKIPKQPYKKYSSNNRYANLSASVLMPQQAAAITVDPLLLSNATASNVTNNAVSSLSAQQKTVFAGFLSTRYRPVSYLTNWWYVATYKRALIEAESFNPEQQTWQNDESTQEFIATALKSFKKHNDPITLHRFLVLANNKSIPLPSLDETQTWLRSMEQPENTQAKTISGCLSMIGMINKKSDTY